MIPRDSIHILWVVEGSAVLVYVLSTCNDDGFTNSLIKTWPTVFHVHLFR